MITEYNHCNQQYQSELLVSCNHRNERNQVNIPITVIDSIINVINVITRERVQPAVPYPSFACQFQVTATNQPRAIQAHQNRRRRIQRKLSRSLKREYNVNVKPRLYQNSLPVGRPLTRGGPGSLVPDIANVSHNSPSCIRTPHILHYHEKPLLFIGYGLEICTEAEECGVGLRSLVTLDAGDPITEYEVHIHIPICQLRVL